MFKTRLQVCRNEAGTHKFNHDVIRHLGTVQHLFWFGPVFFVVRNRRSADAIRQHRAMNDGAM